MKKYVSAIFTLAILSLALVSCEGQSWPHLECALILRFFA